MLFKELKASKPVKEMILDIISLGDPIERIKNNKSITLVECTVKDEEGNEGKITVWGEENIKICEPGKRVKAVKCFVNEWEGDICLTTGKYGAVEDFEEKVE